MSGIVGKNLGRGSGVVTATPVGADTVSGANVADDAIDSEHYTDGSIDNAHIADDAIDSEHYAAGSIDEAHIANNAVTLAKMAGGTDGQIITYDASGDPVAVGPGSDGEVLTSTGAGSPPAFEAAGGGGGAWTLISSVTASGSATVDFLNDMDSTYDMYMCTWNNVMNSADSKSLRLRVAFGGTVQTGSNYDYAGMGLIGGGAADDQSSSSDSTIKVNNHSGNATGEGTSGILWIHHPSATDNYKIITYQSGAIRNDGTLHHISGSGTYLAATTAVTGIQFYPQATSTFSGEFYLYGANNA